MRIFAHPGDVDGNNIVNSGDVDELINVLRGVVDPAWGKHSADIDRSGAIAPADLLALIDVLVGAGGNPAWLLTSVTAFDPQCP